MRNHALTLRLNDDEWEHLKNLVEATDYTTQTFLRKMILGEEVKPKRPEQFRDLLYELSAITDATNAQESPTKTQTITDKHLRLLEVIAEDIGYQDIHWDDIKQYYYPVGLSTKKQDEAVLRKVQIDAALAQIKESQGHQNTAQTDSQTALNNQMLLKALENPDGFVKLVEAAEKAQNLGKNTKQRR